MDVLVPDGLVKAKRARLMVLMVGSGVSASLGLPTWRKLLEKLAESAPSKIWNAESINSVIEKAGFEEAAQQLVGAYGDPDKLAAALEQFIALPEGWSRHGRIASIRELKEETRGIITSNFDYLLEKAYDAGTGQVKYRSMDDLKLAFKGNWWIFKIHGDPSRPDDLVFTREQYERLMKDSRYMEVLEKLFADYVILFVGYSLSDRYVFDMISGLQKRFGGFLGDGWAYAVLPASSDESETKKRKYLRNVGLRFIEYDATKGHDAVDAILNILNEKTGVPEPVIDFTGREGQIAEVEKRLKNGENVFLVGGPAIGKTELARVVAQKMLAILAIDDPSIPYGSAVQIDLIGKVGAEPLLAALKAGLSLKADIRNMEAIIDEALAKKPLILLDNLEDPLKNGTSSQARAFTVVLDLLATRGKTRDGAAPLLGTCRPGVLPQIQHSAYIDVSRLADDEARQLFQVIAGKIQADVSGGEMPAAREISPAQEELVRMTQGHPFAIRLAALGCATGDKDAAFLDAAGKLKEKFPDPLTLFSLLALSSLDEQSGKVVACLAPWPAGAPSMLCEALLGESWVRPMFAAVKAGLVYQSGGRYRMLEALRQIVMEYGFATEVTWKARTDGLMYYNTALVRLNKALGEVGRPEPDSFALIDETPNIIVTLEALKTAVHKSPKVYPIARKQLDMVLHFNTWAGFVIDPRPYIDDFLGDESMRQAPDVHPSQLFQAARTLIEYGDVESTKQAIALQRKVVAIYKVQADTGDALGLDSYLASINNLALVLTNMGGEENEREAISLYEEGLATRQKIFDEATRTGVMPAKGITKDDLLADLSGSMLNLANRLKLLGTLADRKRAEALLRKALEYRRQFSETYPEKEARLGIVLQGLANFLHEYPDPASRAEAITLSKESISLYKKLAEKVPGAMEDVGIQSLNLASELRNAQNLVEAKAYLKDAISIFKELSEKKPSVRLYLATALGNMGNLLKQAHADPGEIADYYKQSIAIGKEIAASGNENAEVDVARSAGNFADFLVSTGKKEDQDEAEAMIRLSVGLFEKHARTKQFLLEQLCIKLQTLGTLLLKRGTADAKAEGRAAVDKALAISRKLATMHPSFLLTLASALESKYNGIDRDAKGNVLDNVTAEAILREQITSVFPRMIEVFPNYQDMIEENMGDAMINLGCALNELGGTERVAEALKWNDEGEQIVRRRLDAGKSNPLKYVIALYNKVEYLGKLDRNAEADGVRKVVEEYKKAKGIEPR
nr:SIR2 family protein [Candidatus Sigynarchaeum springense]